MAGLSLKVKNMEAITQEEIWIRREQRVMHDIRADFDRKGNGPFEKVLLIMEAEELGLPKSFINELKADQ